MPPGGNIPLLVLRVPELDGVRGSARNAPARALARRCVAAFAQARSRMLRQGDVLAYDGGAHLIALLLSPARDGICVAAPTDCRATLVRLATAVRASTGVRPEGGWTLVPTFIGRRRFAQGVEEALRRGAGERERHAFFTSIGHELRTPLTAIRGYLETLSDEELDAETARRFLETAQAEAARMGRLVDGLHEIAQLDDSDEATDEYGDLQEALAAALDAVVPFAGSRRTIISQLEWQPRRVLLSTDRLTQILVNILENAVKHGSEAGRVFVSAVPLDDRYAEVRVDDDGPGVPGDERAAVFQLERRGTNARAHGHGLGLALVRLMVERIGGEVDVGPSPLGGARFRLRVPLAPA